MEVLQGVRFTEKADGSWEAIHEASGKVSHGLTEAEATDSMKNLLEMNDVSKQLAIHSGFARLESFESGIAFIKLGGGCSGCPSSAITLINGVKTELQEKFGEEVVVDVAPSI